MTAIFAEARATLKACGDLLDRLQDQFEAARAEADKTEGERAQRAAARAEHEQWLTETTVQQSREHARSSKKSNARRPGL